MVPWFRRAYNQLKMKVRALPTWRNPVGDGAKRTRGFPGKAEFMALDIEIGGLPMVRVAERCRQAGSKIDFLCNHLIRKEIEGGQCT
jgi:hypothetical protein